MALSGQLLVLEYSSISLTVIIFILTRYDCQAQSLFTTQPEVASMAQFSPTTQSSSLIQSSSSDVTTQAQSPPPLEDIVIESVRFVFLEAFWDDSFSQQVIALLTSFLNQEMAMRKTVEPGLDTWFEITDLGAVVEDTNETTHLDTRIAHAWPEKLLYLFTTTEFEDFVHDKGNLTLLVACRWNSSCWMSDEPTYYTSTPRPSIKIPQLSSSSPFDKSLPVLIVSAVSLVVMVMGAVCAMYQKRRRSQNAGNDVDNKSTKDNQSNCEGIQSPFTDDQIMSNEGARDGSANGSAADGGKTIKDDSWIMPRDDIQLDEIK